MPQNSPSGLPGLHCKYEGVWWSLMESYTCYYEVLCLTTKKTCTIKMHLSYEAFSSNISFFMTLYCYFFVFIFSRPDSSWFWMYTVILEWCGTKMILYLLSVWKRVVHWIKWSTLDLEWLALAFTQTVLYCTDSMFKTESVYTLT